MKYLYLFVLISSNLLFSQVGINTTNPRATLHVAGSPSDASVIDGIIAPRISRSELIAKTPIYSNQQRGALLYVTNLTGTTNAATVNVTRIGYYYFDGSIWQRLVNDNLYNANGSITNPRSVFLGNQTLSFFGDGLNTFSINNITTSNTILSADAANDRVGIGTTSPNAKLDIRTSPTSTTDPGEGMIGIGTTSTTATTAGSGAIRYSTSSGGILQYSNGVTWNSLTSTVQKATVVAKKTTAQTFPSTVGGVVVSWLEITDLTNNFDPVSATFTAPRTGNYIVSFSFSFNSATINAGSVVEAQLQVTGTGTNRKSLVSYPSGGTGSSAALVSFTLRLNAGDTVRPAIYHNTGSNKTLRVGSGSPDGFVNFSVAEL